MQHIVNSTFLCVSETYAPEVHTLTREQRATLDERLRIASKRESDAARQHAYRVTFGKRFDYAIPCWSRDALEAVALEYTGAHQERVRFIAAAIVLGEPFSADGSQPHDDTDGGQKVLADHSKPKPRKPSGGGAAVSLASMFADAQS